MGRASSALGDKMTVKNDHRTKPLSALRSCSLFLGLPEKHIETIAAKMELATAPRGRLIMQHGDKTTETYFLLSGAVIGQLVAQNGREILFTEIGGAGYFGELAALDGAARSITISAVSDCRFMTLSDKNFLQVLARYPQVAINLARDLAARLRQMNDRVFGLVVHDVETRVRIRLSQLAQEQEKLVTGGVIENSPTHEAMASFIGSNREAVSRAIARLNKAGIIASSRQRMVIQDLDKLIFPLDGLPVGHGCRGPVAL